jgi:putative DNA primase/helicase
MSESFERVEDALRFIPVGGHDERVRLAFALKSELGEDGRPLWDAWRDGRGDDEADSVWKSASDIGPVTIGTLFHEAKAHGWHDGERARPSTPPSPEALERRRREKAQAEAEDEAARARAATWARAIVKAASPASPAHPYLGRKAIAPTPTLMELDAGTVASILGYAPQASGEPLSGPLLVAPIARGGKLVSVELIDGEGRKAALPGRGTKAGGYWATGRLPDGPGEGLTLLIGEGVATCLTASTASGYPGIAALSSGVLLAVAGAMRERYPRAALVILADLIKASGEADPHAIAAARASGGRLAIPDFGPPRQPGQTDFNDMAAAMGLAAVRKALAGATAPPNQRAPARQGRRPRGRRGRRELAPAPALDGED